MQAFEEHIFFKFKQVGFSDILVPLFLIPDSPGSVFKVGSLLKPSIKSSNVAAGDVLLKRGDYFLLRAPPALPQVIH